jgi:hypothetical protein
MSELINLLITINYNKRMKECLKQKQLHADYSTRVMESGNHFKNGASLKRQKSKGNIFMRSFAIISILLLSNCVTIAYGQNCESLLRQAAQLVDQGKYCDAIGYYQRYADCNADVDVSTEIAMCKRRCGLESPGRDESSQTQSYTQTQSNQSQVKSNSNTFSSSFSGFQLHGGVFLPQGDFDDVAATGYNLGFKVYKPISSVDGLSWFVGADALYNGLDKDFKKALVEETKIEDFDSYTLPVFLNVPITGGVNYAYKINNKLSIYGEVAAGLNFSKFTDISTSDSDKTSSIKFNIATSFSYGSEVGVLLSNKYTIGIRYYNLGSYKYKEKSSVENSDEIMPKLSISGTSLTFGILF